MRPGQEFVNGVLSGAAGTLLTAGTALYVLATTGHVEIRHFLSGEAGIWFDWASRNFGASIPVFAVLLIAWFATLGRLRHRLDTGRPINEIVQLDHLADTWTTMFFGTGVIWTAIGMRSALLFALGDREAALSQGAFAMLERMVDGGILLALSTTIFGGIGGYLMRVAKTILLGARLQAGYDAAARADSSAMRASLARIEARLEPAAVFAAAKPQREAETP